ncbi:MAG: thiamine phosphate synthase [Candidatus Hydrogenedentota bacterium]
MARDDLVESFRRADLYVVITEEFCAGRPSLNVLDLVLEAGVLLVQFREKGLDDRELVARAEAFRRRTFNAGALLIVDDRVDVALAVGADGVHLGQRDMPIHIARNIAPDLLIGASTHNLDQALVAEGEGADYVNIGPIFATQTKTKTAPPLGPGAVRQIAPRLKIPFTCMGGIKEHNIREVLECGARHPAVVTAVTAAPDPMRAASALRQSILDYFTSSGG